MLEPPLYEQFEDLEKQAHAWRLGMWVFLASETLLFAGLLALYAAYRVMYGHDFREAIGHNDVRLGTLNTVLLITSSLTVAMSVGAVRRGLPRRAARLLAVSIGLGLVFLVVKGFEYMDHARHGILPGAAFWYPELSAYGARTFFTLYYLMTGLHALHVLGGLAFLSWVALRCRRGLYSSSYHLPVELGGLYWHLVDVIWIFLWPLLYLSR